ncbi:acyltransferase [Cryobacterium sp. TmT2-59]|uniref:acyltransferase n=1 Tax=Cryobacterium sp. TmT2-59 TaxID=1259264 RepID=UPI00141A858F|nr:acyltransferase [Cryobacterium sp. TmT2-59]
MAAPGDLGRADHAALLHHRGGFAGHRAWTAAAAAGLTPAEFIRGRILRLARPAAPLFLALTSGILVLQWSGVDRASVLLIGAGVTSALWFLAAYAFSQAFLPGMVELHARARVLTLLVLLGCAIVVEAGRLSSGLAVIGIFNMIFIWLFLQQLGFWVADGWFARRGRAALLLLAADSFLLLWGMVQTGLSRVNILEDLNPPSLALTVLSVGQFALLALARPVLHRIAALAPVRVLVGAIGARLITIYLWHVPVIALLVGLTLLTPWGGPAPETPLWWWTRPAYFAATVAALFLLSALLGRLEWPVLRRIGDRAAADWAVSVSTLLIVLAPFCLMVFGLNVWVAATGTLALAASVGLQRMRRTVTIRAEMTVPLIRGL